MATGTWDPNQVQTQKQPELGFIRKIAALEDAALEQLTEHLSELEISENQFLMKLSYDDWVPALEQITDSEKYQLMKFFTLAEEHLPDWHGGDKNPVIWIFRFIKKHDQTVDPDIIRWVKSHTRNRFLPYGSIL